jgi:hypothetical protein
MATQTFQARVRSTAGSALSVWDRANRRPVRVLPLVLAGPIQFQLEDVGSETLTLGFLPAFAQIEKVAVMRPAGAGTYTLRLPAYNGLALQNIVAAGASGTSTADATLAVTKYASYSQARPLELVGAGLTGPFNIGIWVIPLDNAQRA